MENVAKKMMIYSLAGIMQIGSGLAIVEASPLHSAVPQQIVQLDNNDRHQEHDRRQQAENQRHEQEMRRRHNESDRDWNDRRETENRRHNDALQEIEAFLLGIGVGAILNR